MQEQYYTTSRRKTLTRNQYVHNRLYNYIFQTSQWPSFMIQFARRYIHIVDTVNRRLGRVMMYYGCLLHSWGALFHPVGGKCPNGFVLQWLDYSQKGSGRCHHCTFFNFLSWGNVVWRLGQPQLFVEIRRAQSHGLAPLPLAY